MRASQKAYGSNSFFQSYIKKLYICFMDVEKAFDRVPKKVMEWEMRKKDLPEIIVRVVMSLYHRAKTKVRVGSELSEEFLVQVDLNQKSVLTSLLLAIAEDVISENAIEKLMNEIMHADDLVLMSESTENLKEKFFKWKEAFERKGLKVNLEKTKVMVSGSKGEIFKSKVDPCAKYGKKVMANLVMCTKCGKWVHGRCAKMKRVTSTQAKEFVCKLCVDTKEEIVEPGKEISFFHQVDFVKSFSSLRDGRNASDGSEAAVTAKTKTGWVQFRECGELLYEIKFL